MTITEDVRAPMADGQDQLRAERPVEPDTVASAAGRRRWPRLLAAVVALWATGLVAGLSLGSLGDDGSVDTTAISEPGRADPPPDRSTSTSGGAEPFSAPAPALSLPAPSTPDPTATVAPTTAAPTTTAPTTTAPSTTAKPTTIKPATTPKPTATAPAGNGDAQLHQQILTLVNEERAAAGCAALSLDGSLTAAATAHSVDMAAQGYFSHTGLDGSQPWDRARAAGYGSSGIGENIAAGYGSAEAVVSGWMNSSGHRANILNCGYRHLGVGYAAQGNHWTQLFGG